MKQLTILIIIGIVAVGAVFYGAGTKRSRAEEAVKAMRRILQAERDNKAKLNSFFDVYRNQDSHGYIQNPLTDYVTDKGTGTPSPLTAGANVDVGMPRYFSNHAFSVDAYPADADGASNLFTNPKGTDFIISTNGADSVSCAVSADNCAFKAAEVSDYRLEMDSAGRVAVSYDSGAHWARY